MTGPAGGIPRTSDSRLTLELSPEQPEQVTAAIAAAIAPPAPAPDPWWQAGLEAALETD